MKDEIANREQIPNQKLRLNGFNDLLMSIQTMFYVTLVFFI